jgi:hypothetical protein
VSTFCVLVGYILIAGHSSDGETVVYTTDFDSLTIGLTQNYPGDPGQDGWFFVGAGTNGYGEIQNSIANAGNALHEFASGNGMLKSERGIDVNISAFNGVDNNSAVPLTIGQGLAWDTWHTLTLVMHQTEDHYISLTVDGEMEDLTAYPLPRSEYEGVWNRGQLMETINAQIVSSGELTDDDVYWDNLSLSINCDLKADLTGDCKVDLEDLAVFASEWLAGT